MEDLISPHSHLLDPARPILWRYDLKGPQSVRNFVVYDVRRYMLDETMGIRSNGCLPFSISFQYFYISEKILDFRTLLMNDRNTAR